MTEFQLEGMTVTPLLDGHLEKIHPVIGVAGDTGYVGVWIPSRVRDEKGNVAEKDLLYLITDKGEQILANDHVLKERGWRLAYKPIYFENRWSLGDVKRYLARDGREIDPRAVFEHVLDPWLTYMELPSFEEYVYAALWDIGTYFHHLFNSYPYKYVGGIKRVGKTKELLLHSCLAHNAVFSNNMSPSSIYRLIQNARTTLLIDETEKLSNPERSQEFRSILLAGYKNGEKVYRVERNRRDQLVPEAFEVYSPKALANISGLEDVLEDRCKVTFLRRSNDRRIADREIDVKDPKWSAIRDELYRLYLRYWPEVKGCYDELGEHDELMNLLNKHGFTGYECLTAREWELWKPIIALARFFDRHGVCLSKFTSSPSSPCSPDASIAPGGSDPSGRLTASLCSSMLGLAVADSDRKLLEDRSESRELVLMEALMEMVQEPGYKDGYIPVREVKDRLAERFDAEEQKWLTSRWVGRALRRLGFDDKERTKSGYKYLIRRLDVEQLAGRLGIGQSKPSDEEVHTPSPSSSPASPPPQPSISIRTPSETPIQSTADPLRGSGHHMNLGVEGGSDPKPPPFAFRPIDAKLDFSGKPGKNLCEWCQSESDLIIYNPEEPDLKAFICRRCGEEISKAAQSTPWEGTAGSPKVNQGDTNGLRGSPLDSQQLEKPGDRPGSESEAESRSEPKPAYYWRRIPAGERCGCGEAPVEFEVSTNDGEKRRMCPRCFRSLSRMGLRDGFRLEMLEEEPREELAIPVAGKEDGIGREDLRDVGESRIKTTRQM